MKVKGQKRQDILKYAGILFKDKGFHNTKMDDIAVAAGVGKGTLYEYFKSKQDIFDEACIEYVELTIETIQDVSNMESTFDEKLLALFNVKVKMESEFENIIIDNVLSWKNIMSEKTVKTIIKKISEIYKLVATIIDQGKEEGVVVKNIPSEIIACSIIGTMSEYLVYNIKNKDNEIKEDDLIINLLYNGFAVK